MGIPRLGAVVLVVICLMMPRSEAAELEGFGPIKFGMGPEEALAALDALGLKWEWVRENRRLEYEYTVSEHTMILNMADSPTFKVVQSFIDGKARDVTVEWIWTGFSPELCFSDAYYFIAAIKKKYEDASFLEEYFDGLNVKNILNRQKPAKTEILKLYALSFDDESLIHITLWIRDHQFNAFNCNLYIWYHPPVPNPIPF